MMTKSEINQAETLIGRTQGMRLAGYRLLTLGRYELFALDEPTGLTLTFDTLDNLRSHILNQMDIDDAYAILPA